MTLQRPTTGDDRLDALLMATDPAQVAADLLVRCFTTKDTILPSATLLKIFQGTAALAGGAYRGRWKRAGLGQGLQALVTQTTTLWERSILTARAPTALVATAAPYYLLQRGYAVLSALNPTEAARAELDLQ